MIQEKVIAISNQKDGTGKTMICANLETIRKALIIDTNAQVETTPEAGQALATVIRKLMSDNVRRNISTMPRMLTCYLGT